MWAVVVLGHFSSSRMVRAIAGLADTHLFIHSFHSAKGLTPSYRPLPSLTQWLQSRALDASFSQPPTQMLRPQSQPKSLIHLWVYGIAQHGGKCELLGAAYHERNEAWFRRRDYFLPSQQFAVFYSHNRPHMGCTPLHRGRRIWCSSTARTCLQYILDLALNTKAPRNLSRGSLEPGLDCWERLS